MDIYLPADFYALQDELRDDWRDTSTNRMRDDTIANPGTVKRAPTRSGDSCADPTWHCL